MPINAPVLFQDKLLSKLEESEPELATCQEEEVITFCFFCLIKNNIVSF